MHRLVFHHCFIKFFLAIFLATFAATAYCHPHAFIITSFKVVFDYNGVKGVQVSWVFDEMYSATTAAEFDLDGNGSFSKNESEELVRLGNESLPDVSYFTNIHIDGEPYLVKSVRDFSISYEKGILTYNFFIDCPIKASGEGKKLKISPYDQEFRLAMFFDEEQPYTLENNDQYKVLTKVEEDKETLIFFNSIHPVALHIEFQRR